MSTEKKLPKIPIILYEESAQGETNLIPYIEVGIDEEMPTALFISEYKETGEFEIGSNGKSPIVDMVIRQYVNMDHLKKRLDAKTYDRIRVALGMQPLKKARKKGQQILNKVFVQAQKNKQNLEEDKELRSKRAFELGEILMRKSKEFLDKEKEN